MRDEVLVKRQLVAMVIWILANKRVRKECLHGERKEKRNRAKREKGGRLRGTVELNTLPDQSN